MSQSGFRRRTRIFVAIEQSDYNHDPENLRDMQQAHDFWLTETDSDRVNEQLYVIGEMQGQSAYNSH